MAARFIASKLLQNTSLKQIEYDAIVAPATAPATAPAIVPAYVSQLLFHITVLVHSFPEVAILIYRSCLAVQLAVLPSALINLANLPHLDADAVGGVSAGFALAHVDPVFVDYFLQRGGRRHETGVLEQAYPEACLLDVLEFVPAGVSEGRDDEAADGEKEGG